MSNDRHRNAGFEFFEVICDVRPGEMTKEASAGQALSGSPEAQRAMCRVAGDMYEACGKQASAECILYRKLASEDLPASAYQPFTDPFLDMLGEGTLVKEAKVPFVPKILGTAAAMTPSALAVMGALSILSGAGVGGVSWVLNRNASEDDAELENMSRRREQYAQATAELSAKLRRRGLLPLEGYEA